VCVCVYISWIKTTARVCVQKKKDTHRNRDIGKKKRIVHEMGR